MRRLKSSATWDCGVCVFVFLSWPMISRAQRNEIAVCVFVFFLVSLSRISRAQLNGIAVCVCVCARVRACVRACVRAYNMQKLWYFCTESEAM